MGVLAGAASLSTSILTLKSELSENIDQISNNVQYYGCSDGPTLSLINIEVSYIFHDHNLFNSYCLACHHCSLTEGKSTYGKNLSIWNAGNNFDGAYFDYVQKEEAYVHMIRLLSYIYVAGKLKSTHVRLGL